MLTHRIHGAVLFFSCTLGSIFSFAEETKELQGEPLFNGKDLSGWVVEGKKESKVDDKIVPTWSARDGMIHCAGDGYGFLRYDEPFEDFTLHVEYRMSRGCNSGIGIRGTKFTGKGETRPSAAGYEVQILDDSTKAPGSHTSGSLYRYVAPKVNASLPAGEWNVIDIECRGPKIKITLNGKVIHDLDQSQIPAIQDKPLSGYICIQTHGSAKAHHPIEFRNITVQKWEKPKSKS